MIIRIVYCGQWGYNNQAQVVASELKEKFGRDNIKIEKVVGSGGVFDVILLGDGYDTADRIVFSKHIKGRFPKKEEITELLK